MFQGKWWSINTDEFLHQIRQKLFEQCSLCKTQQNYNTLKEHILELQGLKHTQHNRQYPVLPCPRAGCSNTPSLNLSPPLWVCLSLSLSSVFALLATLNLMVWAKRLGLSNLTAAGTSLCTAWQHSQVLISDWALLASATQAGISLMPQGSTLWYLMSRPSQPMSASGPCSSQHASTRYDIKTVSRQQHHTSDLTFCVHLISAPNLLCAFPLLGMRIPLNGSVTFRTISVLLPAGLPCPSHMPVEFEFYQIIRHTVKQKFFLSYFRNLPQMNPAMHLSSSVLQHILAPC